MKRVAFGISSYFYNVALSVCRVLRAQGWEKRVRSWVAESPSTRDVGLFSYQLRKRGLRKTILGQDYDDTFYEELLPLKDGYRSLGKLVLSWAQPASACDFGCGNGFLIQFLSERGVRVRGVDYSSQVLNFVDPAVKSLVLISDLTKSQNLGTFDLVISTEVAEHLPKKASRTFVQNLTSNASKKIVFTAARPGQWGDGHINCQPKDFWIRLFEEQGWSYDSNATERFMETVEQTSDIVRTLPWMIRNFMLFVPQGTLSQR